MFLQNIRTLLKRPGLGLEFAAYNFSRLSRRGNAMRIVSGNIKVTGFSGFSEYHYSGNVLTAAELRYLLNCEKADGDVIDVGANLGIVSVILARRFPERQLHAFEPNPSTFSALQQNLANNHCVNAVAHASAVADHDGTVTFEANPRYRGTTSIATSRGPYTISVPSITLDNFVEKRELNEIAFLKVDVEGYEKLVFSGASELLRERRVAIVFFEICPAHAIRAGFAPEEPAAFLKKHGYLLAKLDGQGCARPAELSEIAGIESENWIALRP